ncbi:MAG: hypothetical protein NPIRA02_20990 [Nitrospirales bacterium]|nr:MAG: hypothetical protein NPIRA02_20990 [Nitrospirales bacterium]
MDSEKISAGGNATLEEIVGSNRLRFQAEQNGLAIAVLLLTGHTPGAPVVDRNGTFVGFISEFNLLQALADGKDLNQMTAEDLMAKDRVPVTAYTTIGEAVKIMEKSRFLNLPVEKDGVVIGCITRHDLLQAWVKSGLGLEWTS